MRIAKGLNLALSSLTTVDNYIRNGGGFAVQMASAVRKELDWENHASILLDPQTDVVDRGGLFCPQYLIFEHIEAKISPKRFKNGARQSELKLLGFPYATKVEGQEDVNRIAVGDISPVYDVVRLGQLSPGNYKISIQYDILGENGVLTLTVKFQPHEELGAEIKADLVFEIYHYTCSGVVLCRDSNEVMLAKVLEFRLKLFGEAAEKETKRQDDLDDGTKQHFPFAEEADAGPDVDPNICHPESDTDDDGDIVLPIRDTKTVVRGARKPPIIEASSDEDEQHEDDQYEDDESDEDESEADERKEAEPEKGERQKDGR